MGESRNPVNRIFGAVVPRAVEAVDPDELLDRIDVDALLDRIDVNRLLDRIDVDRLMTRVDVDALLARVDVDALVQRVDANAIVQRVDVDRLMTQVDVKQLVARAGIDQIVAETTSGLADRTIDLARRQVLVGDLILNSTTDRLLRRRHAVDTTDAPQPAGPVSRLLAFLADGFAISTTFGILASVVAFLSARFFGTGFNASGERELLWILGYGLWAFLYLWGSLEIAGRTPGKSLLGLRVVSVDGSQAKAGRLALRTLLLPLVFVVGLGAMPALLRADRRALHDLIGGTREIVDWGGRQARLPAVIESWLARPRG